MIPPAHLFPPCFKGFDFQFGFFGNFGISGNPDGSETLRE
jgi:hypothetical protein